MGPLDSFWSLNGITTPLIFLQCLSESNGYWGDKVFINGEKKTLKVKIKNCLIKIILIYSNNNSNNTSTHHNKNTIIICTEVTSRIHSSPCSNNYPIMKAITSVYPGSHKKCPAWNPMKVVVELKFMHLLMLGKNI